MTLCNFVVRYQYQEEKRPKFLRGGDGDSGLSKNICTNLRPKHLWPSLTL